MDWTTRAHLHREISPPEGTPPLRRHTFEDVRADVRALLRPSTTESQGDSFVSEPEAAGTVPQRRFSLSRLSLPSRLQSSEPTSFRRLSNRSVSTPGRAPPSDDAPPPVSGLSRSAPATPAAARAEAWRAFHQDTVRETECESADAATGTRQSQEQHAKYMHAANPLESLTEERKAVQIPDVQQPQEGIPAPERGAHQGDVSAEPPSPGGGGTHTVPRQADLDFFTQAYLVHANID